MKDVCRDCRHAKDKGHNSCYCVKYGIIIGYGKAHCVSYEPGRGEDREQVRSEKDGD